MKLELTAKQFRRLLDMAYIGNWILNSTRGDDRFADYDEVEQPLIFPVLLFGLQHIHLYILEGPGLADLHTGGQQAALGAYPALVALGDFVIHVVPGHAEGAGQGAGVAADAQVWVCHYRPRSLVLGEGPCGASHHAGRVGAVHTADGLSLIHI